MWLIFSAIKYIQRVIYENIEKASSGEKNEKSKMGFGRSSSTIRFLYKIRMHAVYQ